MSKIMPKRLLNAVLAHYPTHMVVNHCFKARNSSSNFELIFNLVFNIVHFKLNTVRFRTQFANLY